MNQRITGVFLYIDTRDEACWVQYLSVPILSAPILNKSSIKSVCMRGRRWGGEWGEKVLCEDDG